MLTPEDMNLALAGLSQEQICRYLEHFETDEWSPDAILKKEILTPLVVDPCTGTGILAEAAKRAGYRTLAFDVYDWGYEYLDDLHNFLTLDREVLLEYFYFKEDFTVFINPPFSMACEFVDKAFQLGARKVVCYQRFAWRESDKRDYWWFQRPPARIWLCRDRASSWRHDLPKDEKGRRYDPETGKRLSNTPTAHAYFVWEQGHKGAEIVGTIGRGDFS